MIFWAWLKLDQAYTTETAPTSFEVVGFLEKNDFRTMPGIELVDLNLTPIDLNAITAHKITILNFWASWCEPCAQEFPSMLKLLKEFEGKIVILAPSHDSNKEDILTFSRAFNLDTAQGMHLLWDKESKVGKLFEVNKLPESYIFDQNGILLRKVVGTRDWYNEDARMYFREITK